MSSAKTPISNTLKRIKASDFKLNKYYIAKTHGWGLEFLGRTSVLDDFRKSGLYEEVDFHKITTSNFGDILILKVKFCKKGLTYANKHLKGDFESLEN